jgi:hypothetical protein
MTDENAVITRHVATAKEHLAGIKAAAVYHQALAARHLLDTQSPIKDRPIPDHTPEGQ